MKAGDIYYSPKTNKLIEFDKEYPFEVCEVDIGVVSYFDTLGSITIGDRTFIYPTGPLFGMTKHSFKDYKKIGELE